MAHARRAIRLGAILLVLTWTGAAILTGCTANPPAADGDPTDNNGPDDGSDIGPGDDTNPVIAEELIEPADLVYRGAFRLPARGMADEDAQSWEYAGRALAYRPDGDPGGIDDGYPGSLFGTGHDITNNVAEISIPEPSLSRNIEELNTATTLQAFQDIRGGLFNMYQEIPRVGLAYVPGSDGAAGRLHMCWGQHFHEEVATTQPTHASCSPNLSAAGTTGAWWLDNQSLYSVNGYLFHIPAAWAERYAGGMNLATGRYRDGGWSGMGPSLYAYAPPAPGAEPSAGSTLEARTLLRYSHTRGDDTTEFRMNDYQHADEWEGGAWLTTSDDRSAVVFVGTKGSGYLWYGFISPAGDGMPCVEQNLTMIGCYDPDGVPCPDEMTGYCEGNVPESRGWWNSRWDAQMIFYDPADLARVANGEMEPYEPQPYAVLDIDEHLFLNATTDPYALGSGDQRRYRIGETAYDRERNLIYVLELFADTAQPVVHVWAVAPPVHM